MSAEIIFAIVLASILFLFLLIILLLMPRKAYFTALFSGAYVSLFKLISLKLRKQNVEEIVNAFILAKKSRLSLKLNEIEVISSSKGHPLQIVEGLNAAKCAKLPMDLDFIKSVDISGRNVLEVVRECINPKIIEMPLISAVAQDNIEVNVKVSLTLKINVNNFLHGVTEETISARAVEAVVTKIANTELAKSLVSKPELMDKAIFDASVDNGSKFELVSADVIHIDLGINRGLFAEKEQIEKSRILGVNQLEHRRLIAVAMEHEMKAKAEEMKAKVFSNEAEVPKAIIKAIEEGKLKDVIDYYKLQNLQADTEMRRFLVGKGNSSKRED